MATVGSSARTDPEATPAHVAVVSFLASRVVPSGGFWVALAGGVALARVSERRGGRQGFGTSIAAMLETVAIIGPLRFGVPLTQAVTAPLLGRYEARGMRVGWQMAICTVLRLLQNAIQTAFFIFVLAGGLDAVTGTYDRFAGWVGLEVNDTGTLILTAIGLMGWAVFASVVQVLVYRRGLARWDEVAASVGGAEATGVDGGGPVPAGAPGVDGAGPVPAGAPAAPGAADRALADAEPASRSGPALADAPPASRSGPALADPRPGASRFDPRLLALVAVVLFGVLLASTAWVVLLAVGAFLVLAWAVSRPDPAPLQAGLAFTALLAGGVLVIALVGGLGIEVALRRALRAGLLVMTATWLRAAARAEGLRWVFHRALHRLRRVPSVPEASEVLDSLTSEGRLAASGRAFAEAVEDVPNRPVPFTDAVLGWVVRESTIHRKT